MVVSLQKPSLSSLLLGIGPWFALEDAEIFPSICFSGARAAQELASILMTLGIADASIAVDTKYESIRDCFLFVFVFEKCVVKRRENKISRVPARKNLARARRSEERFGDLNGKSSVVGRRRMLHYRQ